MNQKFSDYYYNFQKEITGGSKPWFNNLGEIINATIPFLFGIAGLILLLYLLWGGFMLMTSQGDAKGVEAAKTKITHAVIGFVIIFIGYWLVQLLGLITGVGQIGDTFK